MAYQVLSVYHVPHHVPLALLHLPHVQAVRLVIPSQEPLVMQLPVPLLAKLVHLIQLKLALLVLTGISYQEVRALHVVHHAQLVPL